MSKQTFTVGQVLTAANLTSLQQTAMLGGAAQAKVASYTLVSADAGTAISMTSTSATTITVNTGLFAAGDTVFIQNLGSGNLTITAGSATVSTAGSLILPTNDAGVLYFVSTGVSIFYDFIQVGAASPLTTKGDLYGFSTLDARIPIGANDTVLTADSTQSLGLKWAAPAGGGKVLQVVTASTTTSTAISSTTYTDTTLTATITPTSASSTILVLVSQYGFQKRNQSSINASIRILRGASAVFNDGISSSRLTVVGIASPELYLGLYTNLTYRDSPATTSATTYKTQGKVSTTADSATVTYQDENSPSTITLLEIGA